MARKRSVEEQLLHLKSLQGRADSPEARAELTAALHDRNNLFVARAAEVIGKSPLPDLICMLETAFHRLLDGGDKGCIALTAIATALHAMEATTQEVWLKGIRHVQREKSFGPSSDAAVNLRGICAMGMVQMGYRGALAELADLLADPEPGARAAAARALAACGREEAAPLLRLKALLGDRETEVTAECLASIARLKAPKWLDLLTRFLDSSDAQLCDAAALALGESRSADALALLIARYEATFDSERREALLLPIALNRTPAATDFVLDVLRRAPLKLANAALNALAAFRGDGEVRSRIESVLRERAIPELEASFRRLYAR